MTGRVVVESERSGPGWDLTSPGPEWLCVPFVPNIPPNIPKMEELSSCWLNQYLGSCRRCLCPRKLGLSPVEAHLGHSGAMQWNRRPSVARDFYHLLQTVYTRWAQPRPE